MKDKTESEHNTFITLLHKKEHGTVVKEYQIIKSKIKGTDFSIDNINKD